MSYISAHTMLKPIAAEREQDELKPIISERTVRRFFGLVFGFAAIGLWLVPSAHESADVVLLKSGFTAIFCFCDVAARERLTSKLFATYVFIKAHDVLIIV